MSYFRWRDKSKEVTRMAGFQQTVGGTQSWESVSFYAVTCVGETEAQHQGTKRERALRSTNNEWPYHDKHTEKEKRIVCWESFCRYVGSHLGNSRCPSLGEQGKRILSIYSHQRRVQEKSVLKDEPKPRKYRVLWMSLEGWEVNTWGAHGYVWSNTQRGYFGEYEK
jgi:hypothetical protein